MCRTEGKTGPGLETSLITDGILFICTDTTGHIHNALIINTSITEGSLWRKIAPVFIGAESWLFSDPKTVLTWNSKK